MGVLGHAEEGKKIHSALAVGPRWVGVEVELSGLVKRGARKVIAASQLLRLFAVRRNDDLHAAIDCPRAGENPIEVRCVEG